MPPQQQLPKDSALAKPPTEGAAKKPTGWRTVGGIFAFLLLLAMCSSLSESGSGGSGSRSDEISAHVMCQEFVRDRLKSPSTAGFALASDATITGGPTTWTVRAHVDSENSFGAELRTNYTCRISYEGNDSWRLRSLDME